MLITTLLTIFLAAPARAQAQAQTLPAWTYENLTQLIQSENIQSIEQLLPRLPEDLRANYILMHESRSLQGASPQNPRVILFGNDARLTCAFNGDAKQIGFDSIECFQFRDRAFDFRQIQFPTPENGLKQVVFSKANQSTDGKTSCTGCHREDPRPNWDGYDRWPGAFGSRDDRVNGSFELENELKAFNSKRDQHPRYRWLKSVSAPTAPYLNDLKVSSRPNLRFTSLTNRMNAWRLLRLMEANTQRWQRLAFATKALRCQLTANQTKRLESAGVQTDVAALALQAFQQTGLRANEWSTMIFNDETPGIRPPYDFLGGYGLLSIDVGMAMATTEAVGGNAALQTEIETLKAIRQEGSYNDRPEFFYSLNSILVDPIALKSKIPPTICAEISGLFVEAAESRRK
jgi:hypothetical protein